MAYSHIAFEISGSVATITLNRPDRLNACSPDMADEILLALDEAHLGPTPARAVVITGAGRAFCAGADLQAGPQASEIVGRGSFVGLSQHYNPLMMKLARLPLPIVAAVHGAAAGIGCSLALACDFVIAARSAYFLNAWANIGLVPDGGATWVLPRLVGKARAMEMMVLGERIGAEKAESWGLIHKCSDDATYAEESRALAERLATGPTVAFGIIRQNLARALECDFGTALQTEAEGQMRARNSADAKRGAAAFVERRKPAFEGN